MVQGKSRIMQNTIPLCDVKGLLCCWSGQNSNHSFLVYSLTNQGVVGGGRGLQGVKAGGGGVWRERGAEY